MNRKQVAEDRMKICESNVCGKFRKIGPLKQCSACLCILQFKTAFMSEECPLGLWVKRKGGTGKCGGCG